MRHSAPVSKPVSSRPALGLLGVALFAFVLLGMTDGSLGVAWPSLRDALGRRLSDLGLLLAFFSGGYLTSSAGYGWAHRRAGTGMLLSVGSLMFFLGLVGFAVTPGWALVAVSAVLLGLGGGLIDTGVNAHAALMFDLGSMNLIHGAFGVGGTLGPLVMTFSLTAGMEWRGGYGLLACLQLASIGLIWWRRGAWAEGEGVDEGSESTWSWRATAWLMVVLFFLYTGVEVATGQWAFTLLTEGRDMVTAVAGAWVAAFWLGLTAGRLGLGFFGKGLSPSRVLDVSILLALVGLGVIWWNPAGMGVVGLPVAGLGMAAVFPTLVSVTPARLGRLRSTSSIGHQLAAANVGAASIPWLLGILAEAKGLDTLGPGLFFVGLALAAVHLVSERSTRSRT
jgi:fucose permease